MSSITISKDAYALVAMHAARYPGSDVCGFLVGNVAVSEGARNISITVDHVIPLFHLCTTSTAMIDCALALVTEYCKSHNSMIAGWYFAPSQPSSSGIMERIGTLVGQQILDNGVAPGFALLKALPDRDIVSDTQCVTLCGLWNSKRAKQDNADLKFESGCSEKAADAVHVELSHRNIVDFDLHMQSPTLNFLSNVVSIGKKDRKSE